MLTTDRRKPGEFRMKQSLRRGHQPVPGGFVISEAPCAFPLRLRRNGFPPCEKCDQERQHAGTESRLGEPFDVLPAHREQSVFLHLRGMDGLGEKQRKMWTAQSFTFQSLSRTQALCYNTYEMYQKNLFHHHRPFSKFLQQYPYLLFGLEELQIHYE